MYNPSHTPPAGSGAASALRKGALISIARPRAFSVECVRGLIWITHDNEPHDILLSAGQRHVATSNARMIVQGLERSALRIQPPPLTRPAMPGYEWRRMMSVLLAFVVPARATSSVWR
jgi:Protein of unknown function (DUF2917)